MLFPVPEKKGQMEMIGLVIIVILISLGMLFMAQFALKEEPLKKVFARQGLATSALSTLMKTTVQETGCLSETSAQINLRLDRHLLKDCAQYSAEAPQGFSQYHCQGKHSCQFLEELVGKLLAQTLGTWGKQYEFHSTLQLSGGSSRELFSINPGLCEKKERDSSKPYLFPTDAGMVSSELFICS